MRQKLSDFLEQLRDVARAVPPFFALLVWMCAFAFGANMLQCISVFVSADSDSWLPYHWVQLLCSVSGTSIAIFYLYLRYRRPSSGVDVSALELSREHCKRLQEENQRLELEILQWKGIQASRNKQQRENEELKKENASLKAEVGDLKAEKVWPVTISQGPWQPVITPDSVLIPSVDSIQLCDINMLRTAEKRIEELEAELQGCRWALEEQERLLKELCPTDEGVDASLNLSLALEACKETLAQRDAEVEQMQESMARSMDEFEALQTELRTANREAMDMSIVANNQADELVEKQRVIDELRERLKYQRLREKGARVRGRLGSPQEVEKAPVIYSSFQQLEETSMRYAFVDAVDIDTDDDATKVCIDYTNYKGKRSDRVITPLCIRFESNQFHTEPQWLLVAYCHEKRATRTFAIKDIHTWKEITE